jgi:uncharacterized delta-60 repeat protein
VTRYLPDGTLDSSFNFSRDYSSVEAAAALPDKSLIVAASQATYGLIQPGDTILHVQTDGSIDPGFNPDAKILHPAALGAPDINNNSMARAITLQTDAKILVAGFFREFDGITHPGIVRLLPNGFLDNTFAAVDLQVLAGTGFGLWARPEVQGDGKVIIAGDFSAINNVPSLGIARLNPNGSVDTGFTPTGFMRAGTTKIRAVVVQGDGKVVIGGKFVVGSSVVPLVRLNTDGSFDSTYILPANFFDTTLFPGHSGQVRDIAQQTDGKLIAVTSTATRFNSDGSVDGTFREPVLIDDTLNANPLVTTINLQQDGRAIIGGDFNVIANATGPDFPRWCVARFNIDGTFDPTLTIPHQQGVTGAPTSFVRQPDGSTLIAFNQFGLSTSLPVIHHNYGKLDPSGTLIANFDPLGSAGAGAVVNAQGFLPMANGALLLFGKDTQNVSFGYREIFPDGSATNSFMADTTVSFDSAFPLADGKALIVSNTAQAVVDNTQLQRLNADGSRDTTFALRPSSGVVLRDIAGKLQAVATATKLMAVQSDGRILLAYLSTDSTYTIERLISDGSADATFQKANLLALNPATSSTTVNDPQNANAPAEVIKVTPTVSVGKIAQIVADRKIVIVGQFDSYLGAAAQNIVRVNPDGTVDPTFQSASAAGWIQTPVTSVQRPAIDNVEAASDGKLLITGTFEAYGGTPVAGLALLNSDGSLDSILDAVATRQKFDSHPAYLRRQLDGSFLLSGPYSPAGQNRSPSFLRIVASAPVISSPLSLQATAGEQFVYQITASNNPTRFAATGLPPGLVCDATLGVISGVPSNTGTQQVQLSATNAGATGTAVLLLTINPTPSGPVIKSGTSATGRVGQRFQFQVITAGASSAARLTATGLPNGLAVDPVSGLISGTPIAAGSFKVTLTVTDGNFVTTATLQLTFTADPALPVIISPSSAVISAGNTFIYQIVAPAESDPTDPTIYSIIGDLPPGLRFDPVTGTISGTFTPTGKRRLPPGGGRLSGGIVTNVQLFATNSHGTSTIPLPFFLAPAGVVNISTRIPIGLGENVLIGGFIVTGAAPKKVIIRGIGPSLRVGDILVPGTVQDPMLELHQGDGALLGSNDDWKTSQQQEIIDTAVAPLDERESGVVATLNPGNYTAIVRGKDGTTGIGLVEVYDLGTASLDTASAATLANISTRGFVQNADNVLIGGFIVSGGSSKVIVRAIGPELTARGVAGALQDTTLELRDGMGSLINSNDNWKIGGQQQQIIDTTVPPTDDREAAIVATLNPGNYTAIVRGKNDSTGIGLVEVYVLQ